MNLTELGDLAFNSTQFKLVFRISDNNFKSRNEKELRRFFDVDIIEMERDITNYPEFKIDRKPKGLKVCTEEDFT
jgi:hypothetical protein